MLWFDYNRDDETKRIIVYRAVEESHVLVWVLGATVDSSVLPSSTVLMFLL